MASLTSAHSALATRRELFTFGDYRMLDRVARLDLRTGAWTELDVPFVARRHNACAELGGEIFVVGGNVASSDSHLDVVQRFSLRALRAAPARPRGAAEERGFLDPTPVAGMLRANPRTARAADRADSAVPTVVLRADGAEIARDSRASFRLHLDRIPALVRIAADVWHPAPPGTPAPRQRRRGRRPAVRLAQPARTQLRRVPVGRRRRGPRRLRLPRLAARRRLRRRRPPAPRRQRNRRRNRLRPDQGPRRARGTALRPRRRRYDLRPAAPHPRPAESPPARRLQGLMDRL